MYITASSVVKVASLVAIPRQIGAARIAPRVRTTTKAGRPKGSVIRPAAKAAVTAVPATTPRRWYTGRPARWSMRVSSHSAAALAITTRALKIHPGALNTMIKNTGSSTTVLATRFSRAGLGFSRARLAAVATSHPTESAIALLKVGDRAVEVGGAEVGPQDRRDPQLGVGDLPQQEVRDAHLAAGANQEIGVGHAVGVQRAADVSLADVLGGQLTGSHLSSQRAEGVEQL